MERVSLVIGAIVLLLLCALPVSAVVIPGMTLTALPDPVAPGDTLTYTITATNSGDETSSPTIIFAYDPNLDYLSGSPPSNQEFLVNPITNPVFWRTTTDPLPERIITIDSGGFYPITVLTRVKSGGPCGTPITSTATYIEPGDSSPPSSVSATVTTATTCGIPTPEFPSPLLPAALLGLLALGTILIRTRQR